MSDITNELGLYVAQLSEHMKEKLRDCFQFDTEKVRAAMIVPGGQFLQHPVDVTVDVKYEADPIDWVKLVLDGMARLGMGGAPAAPAWAPATPVQDWIPGQRPPAPDIDTDGFYDPEPTCDCDIKRLASYGHTDGCDWKRWSDKKKGQLQ